jgi:RNA polymerase sigma-70 factor (sigma-E family)
VGASSLENVGVPDGDDPDEGAPMFDEFYVVELPRLVTLGWALTGNRAVAEELAQETMLRAYRGWNRIGRYDRPGAWTRRVLLNLVASVRRRRRLERAARARMPDPMLHVELDTASAEFWALVRELPPRQRDAVCLFYLDDLSVREVAAALGCAEGTAKAHLHKGRARLAALLGAEGADYDG